MFLKFEQFGKQRWALFECDECGREFKRLSLPKQHLCKPCKTKQTCLERYGVENVFQTERTKQKIRQTCLKRYSVIHHAKHESVKKKFRQTCLEKYGVENTFQAECCKQKAKQTSLLHYGVEYVQQAQEVKESIKKTCLERYGVECTASVPEFREKQRKTCLNRHGVSCGLEKLDSIKNAHTPESHAKRHQTMKRNNSYGKSKKEDSFYELLCEVFCVENVERQAQINEWIVDFYVKSIDTYVQFDGVYWHGKDRDINEILNSSKPRDRIISGTYFRDIRQNEYFKNNNLKLIRITDIETQQNVIELLHKLKEGNTNGNRY